MHKLIAARIVSQNPLRVWWDAEFTTADGAIHRNAPSPVEAQTENPGFAPLGAGGYTLGATGDPQGCDLHSPEAAAALKLAANTPEIMAAIELDIARVAEHYEKQAMLAAEAKADASASDLLGGRPS